MAKYCTPNQRRVLVTWITARTKEGVTLESASWFRLCSSDLRPMKTYTAAILVIVLALGAAIAQQQTTFSSQSSLVLVPTMVIDDKGNIVYGLQAQDFIVEDGGV